MGNLTVDQIGIIVSLVIGVVSLTIGGLGLWLSTKVQRRVLEKNFPILYPHMDRKVFRDVDGSRSQYKDASLYHYTIVNKGDLDAVEWNMRVFLHRNGKYGTPEAGLSFSSAGVGTLIGGNDRTDEFIPSIVMDDVFYEQHEMRLVRVECSDMAGGKYCSCKWFGRSGVPITDFKNTERMRRFKRNNYSRKTKKCKDCEVESWRKSGNLVGVQYGKLSDAKLDRKKYGVVLY